MTKYVLDKVCKHSVRYKQPDKKVGPITIYVPNEALDNPEDPPARLSFTMEVQK